MTNCGSQALNTPLEIPPFKPHSLVRGGDWQTIAPVLFRGDIPLSVQETHPVTLNDGDQIVLVESCPDEWHAGDPAVMLLHGLAGCHQSNYMVRTAAKMHSRGWRTFRLDHRGVGAAAGLADRPYHAGRIHDALAGLKKVEALTPGSPLSAVGFSLSGNLILKLISTLKNELPSKLMSVAAICPAIDLVRSSERIRDARNRFYDRHFAKFLWKRSDTYPAIARELPHLNDPAERPPSLYEFDARVTAPLGGFESVDGYYRSSSAINDLHRIDRPTMILAAEDDPLIPAETFHNARYSSTTSLIMPSAGGHLGFLGKRNRDPDRRWMDWRIIDWLETHWPKL
ncbi:MAG: alpha/beta fold hydrolase [Planctomycetaceae bacterium]|nr:alpha/beta fold hydrolase [Planctomycetaceae bacterium]MDB4786495.1 alpha/beta fold hydrolase [Planctomycetaceae bacterium]MDG2391588.1 alpha/beta fold hydrolase [Planctomycetaceae bacterium]